MKADVIVIGAGASGLIAALHLARSGRQVVVLEARERAGGRIWSEFPRGLRQPVELGAEFVHGGNALLRGALRAAGMRITPARRDMWVSDPAGVRREHRYWSLLVRFAGMIPKGTRKSVGAILRDEKRLAPHERRWLAAFVEGFEAAPVGRMSAEAIRAAHGGIEGTQSRPKQGYRTLIESLESRLKKIGVAPRFRSAVDRIRWKKGGVEVRAGRDVFRARAVVVTVPLGVLQAGAIRFAPALREKQQVIRRLGWGHVARVTLRFDRALWKSGPAPQPLRKHGRANFGFLSAPDAEFPTWWVPSLSAPVVVGWAGGPRTRPQARLTDAQRIARALQSLAQAWHCPVTQLRRHLREAWTHNWTRDPWARGAYSYSVAGFDDGPQRLAEPVAGTLFFAGEATAEELGTVHGAMESGARAAKEVLAAL